jgi:hypothetical protein
VPAASANRAGAKGAARSSARGATSNAADSTAKIAEDLELLDHKLGSLKLAYEQYFLGSRPREPQQLRQEVQKLVAYYSNLAIPNTSLRFKFSSLCARYQAHKRQWDDVLRKIEQGAYSPHRFRAELHQRERGVTEHEAAPAPAPREATELLFDEYLAARQQCGQEVRGLDLARFKKMLEQQETQIRAKLGPGELRFRVAIEDGKVKLKAARARA